MTSFHRGLPRGLPFRKLQIELVDDSGGMVIKSSQDMTEPANTMFSNAAKVAQLTVPATKLLIRLTNRP